MNRLNFVLTSRGLRNTLARAGQVARRFGVTAAKMERRLLAYRDIIAEYGGSPSLPITAVVLDRNPQVARKLADGGVELCVHGLVHTDMARLSAGIQEEHIRRAVDLFNRHGIDFEGFRSPYLRYNEATLDAVERAGFRYDSNLAFYWAPAGISRDLKAEAADGLRRGLQFYNPTKRPAERSLPRYAGGIIEIPVSLPDDEILLDRMGLSAAEIGGIWVEMAEEAVRRQELLTLQLHPERVLHLESALRRLLDFARTGGPFWIATMKEIATWWSGRSGASVEAVETGRGTYRTGLVGPPGLGLVVMEPRSGFSRALEAGEPVESGRKPVVGIPGDATPALRRDLRQLGYFYEITIDKSAVNLYLDREIRPAELEEVIGRCAEPLLADTRWPAPYRAALAVTGDIDCLTLGDFVRRMREG